MDERLRRLEQAQAANPSLDTAVALLRARLGAGEITIADISGAAALKCEAAIVYLGKEIGLDSHPKSFYILVGQEAVQLPLIQKKLDDMLIPPDWKNYYASSHKVVEAALSRKEIVSIPEARMPLTPKQAASLLAIRPPESGYGRVYTELLNAYPEEPPETSADYARILTSHTKAIIVLLKSISKRPKHYLDQVLQNTRRTVWYIETNERWPASHWFGDIQVDQGDIYAKMSHDEFLEWRMEDLLERTAPQVINRLIGPYLS